MSRVLLIIFIMLPLSSLSEAATPSRPEYLRVLTFEQVKRLPLKARNEYIRAVARTLAELEQIKPRQYSFIEQLLSFGSIAYASNVLYQCIGGGVPEPRNPNKRDCGVNEYAGFKCTNANEKICNPLVFGVSSSGKPTCHVNATTKWCFNNTKLGETNFLDLVLLNPENQKNWGTMIGHLNQACNDKSTVAEHAKLVDEACSYVRVQMHHNEEVKKITVGEHTYEKDGMYLGQKLHADEKVEPEFTPTAGSMQMPTNAEWMSYTHYEGRPHVPPSTRPTIPGVQGNLGTPMPNCIREKDHYHHRHGENGGYFHPAQDLVHESRGAGSPVTSAAPGVVVFTDNKNSTGYGNRVIIMHKNATGNIFYTSYNHLQSIPSTIKKGAPVNEGTIIGAAGNTGRSTGAHLHFEIFDQNKLRSDPKNYYAAGNMCKPLRPPPVMVPATPPVIVQATPPRTTASQ